MNRLRHILLLTCLMLASPSAAQLTMMSWNVENLFDCQHDAGKEDWEFLPGSERHWTWHRYWQKLDALAQVIVSAGNSDGVPDLVGLCEIENDTVLRDLCGRSALRQLGYRYVLTDSPDRRGIDVALLYQPARFRLLTSEAIRIPSEAAGLPPTRDVLHVVGQTLDFDTLHVFVVHLPSRTGGAAGDRNRRLAAHTLWQAVERQTREHPEARVVVMGDFNADRHDRVFRHVPLHLTDPHVPLLNLRSDHPGGTYCFRGIWQFIDHILVSDSLLPYTAEATVFEAPWLLETNRTYGGVMPRRTFRGTAYHGGVSDHLPLLLRILPHKSSAK